MDRKVIVCIGRQFGSGGSDVAKKLAQRLDVAFYDKELMHRASKESGIHKDLFARADEQPTNSFLYTLSVGATGFGSGFMANGDYLTNDKLFTLQSDAIRSIASEHSCVIIGRCADYVLRENPDMVSVFIHADTERRVARVMERTNQTAEQARQTIKKTDRRRANYYNYFSDRSWGVASNYHLSLDSGRLGEDGCVEMILRYIELTHR